MVFCAACGLNTRIHDLIERNRTYAYPEESAILVWRLLFCRLWRSQSGDILPQPTRPGDGDDHGEIPSALPQTAYRCPDLHFSVPFAAIGSYAQCSNAGMAEQPSLTAASVTTGSNLHFSVTVCERSARTRVAQTAEDHQVTRGPAPDRRNWQESLRQDHPEAPGSYHEIAGRAQG